MPTGNLPAARRSTRAMPCAREPSCPAHRTRDRRRSGRSAAALARPAGASARLAGFDQAALIAAVGKASFRDALRIGACFAPALAAPPPAAVPVILYPARLAPVTFDDLSQSLSWPMMDNAGNWLALSLDYDEAGSGLGARRIAALEAALVEPLELDGVGNADADIALDHQHGGTTGSERSATARERQD